MDKINMMNLWLDKLEMQHIKLNNAKRNLIDELYAGAMRQVKTRIENKGWSETKTYISSWIEKATGTNMMGPHHLRNAYIMILDKMKSLDKKEIKEQEHE